MTVQEAVTSFKSGCNSPLNNYKIGTYRCQHQTDVFDINTTSGMIRVFSDDVTSNLIIFNNLDAKNENEIPTKFKISNSVYQELKDIYIKIIFK